MKRALWWGIDRYGNPANNLRCCVNDAKDWTALMKSHGFETTLLLNSEATKYNILAMIGNLAAVSKSGDSVRIGFSHHGTSVMDRSGDEPDGYDEALFVYPGDILLDDEMRIALDQFDSGVDLMVVADCCFGGTITRMAMVPMGKIPPRVRYVQTKIIPPKTPCRKRFLEEEGMNHVLLSACADDEYSYEGWLSRNGVLSGVAIGILKDRPYLTRKELHTIISQQLPSSTYPQTPQLEGPEKLKDKTMFIDSGPTPPEPDPPEDGFDWNKIIEFFINLFNKICQIFRKGG